MRKLDGKIASVTGSGRGIGRAIALKLASEGASVLVNDLYGTPGDAVAAEKNWMCSAAGPQIPRQGSASPPINDPRNREW